jgi:hypothetical protein
MNIIEAINSGRKYRRIGEKHWYETAEDYRDYTFPVRAILADDWEVEPVYVTITEEQFWTAIKDARISQRQGEVLAKELRFCIRK